MVVVNHCVYCLLTVCRHWVLLQIIHTDCNFTHTFHYIALGLTSAHYASPTKYNLVMMNKHLINNQCKAQYTPPTRRNCRVSSRRWCVHEFTTSWRQFRRVVGVNTPVGSRDPYGCVVHSHRRIRRQLSRIHVHTADATRLDSFVSSAVCIGLKQPASRAGWFVLQIQICLCCTTNGFWKSDCSSTANVFQIEIHAHNHGNGHWLIIFWNTEYFNVKMSVLYRYYICSNYYNSLLLWDFTLNISYRQARLLSALYEIVLLAYLLCKQRDVSCLTS